MTDRLADVTDQALSLVAEERVALALRVWESLSDSERHAANPVDAATLAEVRRRDEELSSGAVAGRSHDQVMAAARRALGCG